MKVTIISGTNRANSNTLVVSQSIVDHYSGLGLEVQLLDLQNLPRDVFSPDIYEDKPQSFQPFIDAIQSADGVVAVLPEYNGSFPGVFKYFIDLLPFPESLQGKPVALVGLAAGNWGALRSVEHFQQILTHLGAIHFPGRVFIPGVFDEMNEDGSLKDSKTNQRLAKQSSDFCEFMKKFK